MNDLEVNQSPQKRIANYASWRYSSADNIDDYILHCMSVSTIHNHTSYCADTVLFGRKKIVTSRNIVGGLS